MSSMHAGQHMVESAAIFSRGDPSGPSVSTLGLLGLTGDEPTLRSTFQRQYGIWSMDQTGESSTTVLDLPDQATILEIKILRETTPKVWRIKRSLTFPVEDNILKAVLEPLQKVVSKTMLQGKVIRSSKNRRGSKIGNTKKLDY